MQVIAATTEKHSGTADMNTSVCILRIQYSILTQTNVFYYGMNYYVFSILVYTVSTKMQIWADLGIVDISFSKEGN
jgi:hypothetical protein